jgi:hypothetical protein
MEARARKSGAPILFDAGARDVSRERRWLFHAALALGGGFRQGSHPVFRGDPELMGKLDRRNSMKMKRRKAQASKKRREKPSKKTTPAAAAPAKKSRAKAAPPAAPPAA